MNKYIGSILTSDKPVTLGIVEPLDCPFQPFHVRPLRHLIGVSPYASRFDVIFQLLRLAVKGSCNRNTVFKGPWAW